MSGEENIFVYGTLRAGFENEFARMLARSARLLGGGAVKGRLYLIADYPGLAVSDGDEWVRGEVYALADPEEIYLSLDEYEGCGSADTAPYEFERAVIRVLLDSGEWISASAYIYSLPTVGKSGIASGDFLFS